MDAIEVMLFAVSHFSFCKKVSNNMSSLFYNLFSYFVKCKTVYRLKKSAFL